MEVLGHLHLNRDMTKAESEQDHELGKELKDRTERGEKLLMVREIKIVNRTP